MSKRKSLSPEDAPLDAAPGLFKPTEPAPVLRRGRGRDEEEYAKRYGRTTSYRLPDDLRDRFKAIAEGEGVGMSELAEFVLSRFVADYDAGKIRLPKRQAGFALDFGALER